MHAAVAYAGEAESWVQRFKYPGSGLSALDPRPGAVLRRLILEALPLDAGASLVVPVPLHPRRLRTRGFNPARELAREVARASGGRLEARILLRVRDTPSQTGLQRRARRRNVAGAFRARELPDVPVLLVDDVVTTGATLASAARTLRRAGAGSVTGICVARTP